MDQKIDVPGLIPSGKSGKKEPFTQGVMESQGKSDNLKLFAQKVRASRGKKSHWKMKFLEAHLVFKIASIKRVLGCVFFNVSLSCLL